MTGWSNHEEMQLDSKGNLGQFNPEIVTRISNWQQERAHPASDVLFRTLAKAIGSVLPIVASFPHACL